MSQLHTFRLSVTGEGREAIKRLFDTSAIRTSYGCAWELSDHGGVIRCITEQGDGIAEGDDSIRIKGEADGDLPLAIVANLSRQFSALVFEIAGTDLANLHSQRWLFGSGEGRLLDCHEESFGNEPAIVYMLDGKQFLPLPEWVPAIDR